MGKKLEFAARSDTGRVRSQNEDAIALSPTYGYAILADGMGGYNAGEVASAMAVKIAAEMLDEGLQSPHERDVPRQPHRSKSIHRLLTESIQQANIAILDAARADHEREGMGTTIVVALFQGDKVSIAHVGDSRAYRFRGHVLAQITRDHSLLQEQIDAGLIEPEWAPYSENKNLVTRAVGVELEMQVEIHDFQVEEGDIYLLCSDGLSDMMSNSEITEILSTSSLSLEEACEALVFRANENGGHDNVSVVLIRIQPTANGSQGFFGRFINWMK